MKLFNLNADKFLLGSLFFKFIDNYCGKNPEFLKFRFMFRNSVIEIIKNFRNGINYQKA